MWGKQSCDSTPTCNHSDIVSINTNYSVAESKKFLFLTLILRSHY